MKNQKTFTLDEVSKLRRGARLQLLIGAHALLREIDPGLDERARHALAMRLVQSGLVYLGARGDVHVTREPLQ